MAVRKFHPGRGAAFGAIALSAAAALPAWAQDEPPPPLAPRGAKGERAIDPASPDFHGAVLGDLSDQHLVADERVVWAVGGRSQPVWIRYADFELRCESAVIWGDRERLQATLAATRKTSTTQDPPDLLGNVYHAIYAEGGVYVRRDKYVFHASRVLLDFQHDRAYLVDALMQGSQKIRTDEEVPLSLRAAVVRGIGRDRYRAENATFTSCTYEHPHLSFRSSWVEVDFAKKNPQFETGWWPTIHVDTPVGKDVPVLPLPKLGGTLGGKPIQTVEVNNSSRLGVTLGVGFGGEVPREDGTTWGSWQVTPRYRSHRGPGVGISVDHDGLPDAGGRADRMTFDAEFQRDNEKKDHYSDQPFDGIPGGDSHNNRGRADFWYRHAFDSTGMLGEGWRLDLSGAWYSDRGYIPEYDPSDANESVQRETYLQLRRIRGNQGLSVLASHRLNDEANSLAFDQTTDYANQTDYLPSVTWHLVNQPVVNTRLAPLNLSVEAGLGRVERRYDDFVEDALRSAGGWESKAVWRGDVETRLTAPFEIGPVQVTPAIGGSLYHVSDANGFANTGLAAADASETRTSAFYGLRVGAEAHRTWGVKNATFDLDGLRHVASFEAQWFNRFSVSEDTPFEFQTNDLHDQLFEENVLSLRLRNRLQTRREGELVDWIDYEARVLYYVDATDPFLGTGLGTREEFPTPLDRLDFPGEDKYLGVRRDGSAFSEHRARIELTPEVWLVGEADYDMTQHFMQTSAAGVRWFPNRRFSMYLGRRTIHDDSAVWTIRGDYVLSDRWAFSAEFQEDDKSGKGLRSRLALYRRSHDFTIAVGFETERLLKETSFSFAIYPHAWVVRKGDPFSQRRPLDFEALRWYR